MIRFLHTSDWQLGMTRHFLAGEAQARFAQDRVEAVRRLGRIAADEDCEFVVVGGDVFESNQVTRQTVARALDALRAVPVPVFLLPGNHDPLDAGSVYSSREFRSEKPDHVHVIEDDEAFEVRPGVEVIGAPWFSKRPLGDLATAAVRDVEARPGTTRVLVAHGAVDVLSPDADDPALVRLADLEAALDAGRAHYIALGDRHSATSVGETGRVRYSGSPEPTDFRETDPGRVLVVTLEDAACDVREIETGRWRFEVGAFPIDGAEDLDAFESWLDAFPDKARTVVKAGFTGTVSLADRTRLESVLDRGADVFAGLWLRERTTELATVPEDSDFTDLDVSGFAREALDDLRASAAEGDETAGDALALLVRLAGRDA